MPLVSTVEFIEVLRTSRLLEPEQVESICRDTPKRFPDARSLAKELLDRDWLTPYQVNQIFMGRDADLVLGQYILLERLGEGGMGQVFKARHRAMGRIVALKIIRKERLAKPEVVHRFHREVRAAAQLKHPNVVLAFDADEINNTHFFAMEYVDGIDLARWVKTRGPLPVEQACDFIRQAALGLQHAHECGLVHRDIKPANLFVTRPPGMGGGLAPGKPARSPALVTDASGSIAMVPPGPQVKILDMGLARLHPAMQEENPVAVTQEGAVLGTIDFLAPEQAINASNVDLRADIYGLGCTFYYLLTGHVPYPGTTALEKLLKHRCDEPVPVEQSRPEVSPSLAVLVRKMMAKRPEDRYQTAADVALALAALVGQGGLAMTLPAPARAEAALPHAIPMAAELAPLTVPHAIPVLAAGQQPAVAARTMAPMPGSAGVWETLNDFQLGADTTTTRPRHPRRSWLVRFGPVLAVAIVALIGLIVYLAWPGEAARQGTSGNKEPKRPTPENILPPVTPEITNSIDMKLVLVPAGHFRMGSLKSEPGHRPEEGPLHEIEITRPFYTGSYEVTQAQYRAVMKTNPAYFQQKFFAHRGTPNHPVESVTWDNASEFCERLSQLPAEKAAGRVYRLPTEAEWEYACRGGMDKPFGLGGIGDLLDAGQANFRGDLPYGKAPKLASRGRTAEGGSYHANRFHLCDMHGNVWEWCADYFAADYYRNSPDKDPPGPPTGQQRVIRGGSWTDAAIDCRCARRQGMPPTSRNPCIGFRVVMTLAPSK